MGPGGGRDGCDADEDGHGPNAILWAKTEQKKRAGSRTFSARRTVPGEMSDDDEDSAPSAGRPNTLSMARTTAAVVSTSPCAEDAPRARLAARPSRSAVVGFVHQTEDQTRRSVSGLEALFRRTAPVP
jgi:hypothetical protein